MNKSSTAIVISLILVAGAILVALILKSAPSTPMDNRGPMMSSEVMDAQFITQMIPHHQGAIDMAELALDKAEHQELKNLATAIISAQQEEIDSMRAWYQDWYGQEVPANSHNHMGMMTMEGDLEELEASENFDITFIDQMIPHHESAIMMADMIKDATAHPELKTLAKNIIRSQAEEIEQMKTWKEQWK